MNTKAFFEGLAKMNPDERFLEVENAWYGGVADAGDRSAAWIIQTLPGYFNYRSRIEELAFEHLGDTITVYRLMYNQQYEDLIYGAGLAGVAVSLDVKIAKAFKKMHFYENASTVLVSTEIEPAEIIMRGKPEELELVVDGDYWCPEKTTLIEEHM